MATDAQAPNPPRLAADRARRLWLARLASGWKEPVYVATTANVTLSNVQAIDGVAVPDGARVLVKDQTAAAENGIYEAKYGTWLRTSDADHADKLGAATKVAVQRGTTNGGTTWRLTTTAAITLGTTALAWAADGGSGGGTAATTTFTPAAGIAATDVQAAIVELVADVAASYQPLDSDLTAIAALSTTSFGRSLLALANAAALSAAAAAATTSAQGAVELATTAETQTGTDTTRAVTPAGASGTYPTKAATTDLIDAAGDLLVGTADNTLGKLAKGTGLQVLRTNAGATALEWATPSGLSARVEPPFTAHPLLWAGNTVIAANQAYYQRIVNNPGSFTISKIGVYIGVSSGNLSVALLRGTNGVSGPTTRVATSGAVASPGTGWNQISLGGSFVVDPTTDWFGLSADNTTIAFGRFGGAPGVGGSNVSGAGLSYRESAAHPIPSTPAPTTHFSVGFIMYGVA